MKNEKDATMVNQLDPLLKKTDLCTAAKNKEIANLRAQLDARN